jgi:hypothetical protein
MGAGTCLREGEVRDGSRNMPERRRSERWEPQHA